MARSDQASAVQHNEVKSECSIPLSHAWREMASAQHATNQACITWRHQLRICAIQNELHSVNKRRGEVMRSSAPVSARRAPGELIHREAIQRDMITAGNRRLHVCSGPCGERTTGVTAENAKEEVAIVESGATRSQRCNPVHAQQVSERGETPVTVSDRERHNAVDHRVVTSTRREQYMAVVFRRAMKRKMRTARNACKTKP